jgi:ribosomal protein S18 acetylase RimI-like enzyme
MIRNMRFDDCNVISSVFKLQGWEKPVEQYEKYYQEVLEQRRDVIVVEFEGEFVGYLTIVWESEYTPFREQRIPEIVDLNVLLKFRNRGFASKLIDEAERRIAKRCDYAGIGVGLLPDYGLAQRLYVKRGYIPDGNGVWSKGRFINYGTEVVMDDDIALYLKKKLK